MSGRSLVAAGSTKALSEADRCTRLARVEASGIQSEVAKHQLLLIALVKHAGKRTLTSNRFLMEMPGSSSVERPR